MIGKVEILKTLTQKVNRKQDDGRADKEGTNQKKKNNEDKREKLQEVAVNLEELKEVANKLNGYEHYRMQNICFSVVRSEDGQLGVNAISKQGKVIQQLSPSAAKELALRLSKIEESPVKGGLLNISC